MPRVPAEIARAGSSVVLTGTLLNLTARSCQVAVTGDPHPHLLPPGTPVQLTYSIAGRSYVTDAAVTKVEADRIQFELSKSPTPIDNRLNPRIPCRLAGMVRVLRQGQPAGLWKEATIVDLSVSGVRLITAVDLVPGSSAEVQLAVPEREFEPEARAFAHASILGSRRLPDGTNEVRARFVRISDLSRAVLAAIIRDEMDRA